MTRTIGTLNQMLNTMGSNVLYHKEEGGTPCPCLTPEGFRDPAWHIANPGAPVCNEEGMLPGTVTDVIVKATVQPVTGGVRGRAAERISALMPDVQRDDHFGVFPVEWNGTTLAFRDFSDSSGDDYVIYDGRRFFVVASDKVPDIDGDPNHHWEVGLRLVGDR